MNAWVYDLETLERVFTASFFNIKTREIKQFVFNQNINQLPQMIKFLKTEVNYLIGFNCIFFDQPVLEFIFDHPNCSYLEIHVFASDLIEKQKEDERNKRKTKPKYPEYKFRIKNLDLYRALSLSTKSKKTSLKWCEYQMDMASIEDMPEDVYTDLESYTKAVLKYNLHDVKATYLLYHRYFYHIDIRQVAKKHYGINVLNCTEPEFSKVLFAKYLSDAMHISQRDLMKMGTERIIVNAKECIFPYIKFQTKKFQKLKNYFENLQLSSSDEIDYSIRHDNLFIEFGLGGVHAAKKNSIVSSDDVYMIKSADVKSYYPNLIIRNGLHPEHLPQKIFCDTLEHIYDERISIPKSNPRNYILKIVLNSTYGSTNDKFSFLKDRKVTVTVCINGQLLLAMLVEELSLTIPDTELLMMNTDGFEIKIPRKYESTYNEICQNWMKKTKLILEFENYKSMIIRDVNNYISIHEDDDGVKCKGFFNFDDIPLHKNKSALIVKKAIFEYFKNNTPVKDTVLNSRNIYDFCIGVRAKGKTRFYLKYLKKDTIMKKYLSKTNRYFISKKGGYLIKDYGNKEAQAEAPTVSGKYVKDWKVTMFNRAYKVKDFKEYNIDYVYYIKKAKNQIYDIEKSGLIEKPLF